VPTVFVGVGSNLGDRESFFSFARARLEDHPGISRVACSPTYETDPVDAEGGKFLNAVWRFETDLVAHDVLELLREIENGAGRTRSGRHNARTLDLDLLVYGEEMIHEKGMTVPHPRMHERYFVLKPFCDLAPEWTHPVLKRTARELLTGLGRGK